MSWRSVVRSLIEGLDSFDDVPNELLQKIANETSDVPFGSLLTLDDEVTIIVLISLIGQLKEEQRSQIYQLILKELELPKLDWIWWVDDYSRTKAQYRSQTDYKSKIKNILPLLQNLIDRSSNKNEFSELFAALSPFSLSHTPWTDESMNNTAIKIISSLDITQDSLTKLTQSIHEDFKIIPHNDKITKAGYIKAYNTLRFRNNSTINEQNSRITWKENHIKSISNLYTLIINLDEKGIKDNWWVISPSILNILDDYDGPIKLCGVRIVNKLLDVVSIEFFEKTGVDKIFYDAIYPLLSYLPKMTPTLQSKQILSETYPTLIKLYRLKSPESCEKGLLELLNNGIFFTFNSIRDNVEVLKVLVDQMSIIIQELKIKVLKVIPRLIYHLGMILSDPFIDLHSPLFDKALDCLIQLELNGWPALGTHKVDVLGMIAMSYLREKKTTEIGHKIEASMKILERAVGRDNLIDDYKLLIVAHKELDGLFQI